MCSVLTPPPRLFRERTRPAGPVSRCDHPRTATPPLVASPGLPSRLRRVARRAHRLTVLRRSPQSLIPAVRDDVVDLRRRGRHAGSHTEAVACRWNSIGRLPTQRVASEVASSGCSPPAVVAARRSGSAPILRRIPVFQVVRTPREPTPRTAWSRTLTKECFRHEDRFRVGGRGSPEPWWRVLVEQLIGRSCAVGGDGDPDRTLTDAHSPANRRHRRRDRDPDQDRDRDR